MRRSVQWTIVTTVALSTSFVVVPAWADFCVSAEYSRPTGVNVIGVNPGLLSSDELNGFELLAAYDAIELGGDGDGLVTPRDRGWRDLRLWIDRDGNGSSQPEEVRRLEQEGVVALSVAFVETDEVDGNMNWRRYKGVYAQRTADDRATSRSGPVQMRDLIDVIFARPPAEGL